MTPGFDDFLDLPAACRLEQRIPKKTVNDNAALSAADRRILREDVDRLTVTGAVKPGLAAVPPYRDATRDYGELIVLQAVLRAPGRAARLAEVLQRAIPYPLALVLTHDDRFALSLAGKRFSLAEKGAVVAEDFRLTAWLAPAAAAPPAAAFLASLRFAGLPRAHLLALYEALADRVLALDCARLTGVFRLETAAAGNAARRERLAQCHELENRLAALRAEAKREKQIHRLAELNIEIARRRRQLALLTADL